MYSCRSGRSKFISRGPVVVFLFSTVLFSAWSVPALAQQQGGQASAAAETPLPAINLEVQVTAPRQEVPLKDHPAATSIVGSDVLGAMPRGIAADEALRLVPGVKVDNQADGERVHLSIRGQGLLTERGIRGIKVLLDGLPLNDPSGFAPDLFDVDWNGVRRIEVLRGPASALYGGGAAGGVLNIETRDGGSEPLGGSVSVVGGQYGFLKAYGEAGGTAGGVNYRLSVSRNAGDGYREHTAFNATNVYGKARWKNDRITLTAVGAGTNFFNENAEGLNIGWLTADRTQANPDALTYNEFQRTRRATFGVNGRITLAANQDVTFSTYYRRTGWKESVPSSVQHRTYNTPGAIVQYNTLLQGGGLTHHVSAGADMDYQTIDDYRHPNLGLAKEGSEFVADQRITQKSFGFYAIDRVELSRQFGLMVDARADHLSNDLEDRLRAGGTDLSGGATFNKVTVRGGASWNPSPDLGFYASVGQGFLPPATEELANNPAHLGGFNADLAPATSLGEEIGVRGHAMRRLSYDVALFHMTTDNDFGRYRVPSRPLETFYRNAGNSRRYGLEAALTWAPVDALSLRGAYTFSNFKYLDIQSLFGDFSDAVIPNSPRHQLALDAEYHVGGHWVAGLGLDVSSGWFIDQTNATSTDAYALVNPRVAYRWNSGAQTAEVFASARNLLGSEYIAFTEPDPDGNSYQPGPTRELFVGLRLRFGK
jgi:iron complex outermembrane recepter protein